VQQLLVPPRTAAEVLTDIHKLYPLNPAPVPMSSTPPSMVAKGQHQQY